VAEEWPIHPRVGWNRRRETADGFRSRMRGEATMDGYREEGPLLVSTYLSALSRANKNLYDDKSRESLSEGNWHVLETNE